MEIIIYSKENCTFCNKAKHMVKSLGLEYIEKKMEDFESPKAMLEDIGKPVRTMPQIK
jgi:glutaredoxin